MDDSIKIGLVILFGYALYWLYQQWRLKNLRKALIQFNSSFDDYRIKVLDSYDEYLLHHKILMFNSNSESIQVEITDIYKKANIPDAFDKIKNKLSEKIRDEVYDYTGKRAGGNYYEYFKRIFLELGSAERFQYINEQIEGIASDVAIENFTDQHNSIALGSEFIALWAYKSKTKYGQTYPIGTFENLQKGKKMRLDEPHQSKSDFWFDIQCNGFRELD